MPKYRVRRSHHFVMEETITVNAPTKAGAAMAAANLRLYRVPEPEKSKLRYQHTLMMGLDTVEEVEDA